MIDHRPAWPDERERAAALCPGSRPGDTCILAVTHQPVERILAAAFYASLPPSSATSTASDAPVAPCADFIWRAQTRHVGTATEHAFLAALPALIFPGLASAAPESTAAPRLRTRHLFATASPETASLLRAGYTAHTTNEVFSCDSVTASNRFSRLTPGFAALDHSVFEVIDPAIEHLPALGDLIAHREGLLTCAELETALRYPHDPARAFDARWSTVVIERTTGRLIAAHLIRFLDDTVRVPAAAIRPDFGLPGHVLYLCFARFNQRTSAIQWEGKILCRINPDKNPAMQRLSAALGCQSLERLHSYALALNARPAAPQFP